MAANAQANINPNVYRGNTSGPYGAQAPWEWHAGPGPNKRGGMCVTHTDLNRGYGYQAACPAPKAAAASKGKDRSPPLTQAMRVRETPPLPRTRAGFSFLANDTPLSSPPGGSFHGS